MYFFIIVSRRFLQKEETKLLLILDTGTILTQTTDSWIESCGLSCGTNAFNAIQCYCMSVYVQTVYVTVYVHMKIPCQWSSVW